MTIKDASRFNGGGAAAVRGFGKGAQGCAKKFGHRRLAGRAKEEGDPHSVSRWKNDGRAVRAGGGAEAGGRIVHPGHGQRGAAQDGGRGIAADQAGRRLCPARELGAARQVSRDRGRNEPARLVVAHRLPGRDREHAAARLRAERQQAHRQALPPARRVHRHGQPQRPGLLSTQSQDLLRL